jgi:hypothetical protein
MNYYIVDNKEDAEACLLECHEAYMMRHGGNFKYSEGTIRWAELKKRLTDGKYIIQVCNHYTNPHRFIMETSSPDWFETDTTLREEQ